jgi:flagellar motor switch protein FliM
MIEMQTIGRVSSSAPPVRKPTRTDASMVADMIDQALQELESGLESDPDLIWAGGFNYASFLDDPRPLGLLLEEEHYRVIQAELRLGNGAKSGAVMLALPAEGRGRAPKPAPTATPAPVAAALFSKALSDQVMRTEADIAAVLHRFTVPLSFVMALKTGDLVPLSTAALDRIVLEGLDGRPLASGRLGQNRGMRAVRLAPQAAAETAPSIEIGPTLRVVAG